MNSELREVQIPLTSEVKDVRPEARKNGRASLHFFLTAILGRPCTLEVARFLQAGPSPRTLLLSRMVLREFAEDFLLWTTCAESPISVAVDMELGVSPLPEPVRWLFGQVKSRQAAVAEADVLLTSNPNAVRGVVLDIRTSTHLRSL